MKKVYMFFVNSKKTLGDMLHIGLFPGYVSDYVYEEEWVLYAYTTNKEHANSFFQLRKKDFFHMTIRKMDDEEFKRFEREASYELKLEEYDYENNCTKTTLITTGFEFNSARSLWIDMFSNETDKIFGYLPYFIVDALNDKYVDATTKLGLNAALLVIDDGLGELVDCCAEDLFDDDYVLSIPDSVQKKLLAKKVFVKVSMASKTLNSFIHIFKDILVE